MILEVDAKYIKDMLNNPDLQPNAAMNQWIQGILLFDFELNHIPTDKHKGPDALSRQEPSEEELQEPVESEDWLDNIALYATMTSYDYDPPNYNMPFVMTTMPKQDIQLQDIKEFSTTMKTPIFSNTQTRKRFIQKAMQFFMKGSLMFKKRKINIPLLVIFDKNQCTTILTQAYEKLGHCGVYGVFHHVRDGFYWPHMFQDVRHHVSSCHQCQVWSTKKVEVSPTIRTPGTIFTKIYVDVMYMPPAQGFNFIVAARDDLTHAAEGRALRKCNAESMSRFFLE